MLVESKGAIISLKDEISSIYKEYLIGIEIPVLKFEQRYLFSDMINKYQADQKFDMDRKIAAVFLEKGKNEVLMEIRESMLKAYE